MSYPAELPVIAVNKVPFPGQVMSLVVCFHFFLTRNKFYQIEAGSKSSTAQVAALLPKAVLLVPYQNGADGDGDEASLFHVGVVAKVLQSTVRRGSCKLTVRAVVRAKVIAILQEKPFIKARLEVVSTDDGDVREEAAAAFRKLVREALERKMPGINLESTDSIPPGALADGVATSALGASYADQLRLLAALVVAERMKIVAGLIASDAAKKPSSSSALILPKLNAAVGGTGGDSEMEKLRKKLENAKIPEGEARVEIFKDFQKLSRMNKTSSDYEVVRSFLEFAAALPWSASTTDHLTLAGAKKQLDDDHCGLEPIKRRITEYLAVLKLRRDMKGPLLCFIGPPGTGKSSLGESIAKAMGRKFHRIALGGVRDEAVIRGHRRTYVGALPGRILEALKKCGSNNPVILLDEIDKMGTDHRGDPAAALLEVLDPVQNNAFTDHYLGVPFDLSQVLFICTGNSAKIPAALKDRMEMIEVPGYSYDEKVDIAKRHLLPKQLVAHGMQPGSVVLEDEAILSLAKNYTRESGVRNLDREIGAVVRYLVAKVVGEADDGEGARLSHEGLSKVVTVIRESQLAEILGPSKFEEDARDRLSRPGVSVGLAFNGTGSGSVLYIEATQMVGKGKVQITGSVADVMQESVHTAVSWIRSNSKFCQITGPILEGHDLHIHFPSGAMPKDGPSAGVAVTVALVSLLSGRRVASDCAMTGEVSLTGLVLPIGGVKEKSLAAHRNGVKRVFLPKRNLKDLHDVPEAVKKDVQFIGVSAVEEVLEHVFDPASPQLMRAKL